MFQNRQSLWQDFSFVAVNAVRERDASGGWKTLFIKWLRRLRAVNPMRQAAQILLGQRPGRKLQLAGVVSRPRYSRRNANLDAPPECRISPGKIAAPTPRREKSCVATAAGRQ